MRAYGFFGVGLGSDGGQGGVWGMSFGSGNQSNVFGPRIDTGNIYGAVFGWGRTTTDPSRVTGGTFTVGIQGGDVFGAQFDDWNGRGARRGRGGGNFNVGLDRNTWGVNFGGGF